MRNTYCLVPTSRTHPELKSCRARRRHDGIILLSETGESHLWILDKPTSTLGWLLTLRAHQVSALVSNIMSGVGGSLSVSIKQWKMVKRWTGGTILTHLSLCKSHPDTIKTPTRGGIEKKDRFQGQTCQPRRNPETNWDSYSTKQFFCLSPGNEAMTLPETNSSPLKIDPCKRRFLLESTIFRGYVSFRECKKCRFQCWGSQTTCTELINPECFFGRVILYTDTCHVLLWFAAIPRGWDMAVSFQNSFWRNATLKVSWSMYTVDIYTVYKL